MNLLYRNFCCCLVEWHWTKPCTYGPDRQPSYQGSDKTGIGKGTWSECRPKGPQNWQRGWQDGQPEHDHHCDGLRDPLETRWKCNRAQWSTALHWTGISRAESQNLWQTGIFMGIRWARWLKSGVHDCQYGKVFHRYMYRQESWNLSLLWISREVKSSQHHGPYWPCIGRAFQGPSQNLWQTGIFMGIRWAYMDRSFIGSCID